MRVLDKLYAKVTASENSTQLQENLELFFEVATHELNLRIAENEELKRRIKFMEKLLDMCSEEV